MEVHSYFSNTRKKHPLHLTLLDPGKMDSENLSKIAKEADQAAKRQDYNTAIPKYIEAISYYPEFIQAYFNLAKSPDQFEFKMPENPQISENSKISEQNRNTNISL